jgi:hypothetical protein
MREELSEIERLKMENIALKYRAMEQQMMVLLNERALVIQQIEQAHPGYKWKEPVGLVSVSELEEVEAVEYEARPTEVR